MDELPELGTVSGNYNKRDEFTCVARSGNVLDQQVALKTLPYQYVRPQNKTELSKAENYLSKTLIKEIEVQRFNRNGTLNRRMKPTAPLVKVHKFPTTADLGHHQASLQALKRILWGIFDDDCQLQSSPFATLIAYSNADWWGCPVNCHFTSVSSVFLGDNLIS
ncbi:hypothetical protein LXL04_006264 [Taraxacum kok-saghyz]